MTPMCNTSNVMVGWSIGTADCDGVTLIKYYSTSGVSQGSALPVGWKPCVQGVPGPTWSASHSTLSYATSVVIDFAASEYQSLALGGDVTLLGSNYSAAKEIVVRISAASLRTFTFSHPWLFVESAAPASIGTNKTGLLRLVCFGTTSADVVATWAVQP